MDRRQVVVLAEVLRQDLPVALDVLQRRRPRHVRLVQRIVPQLRRQVPQVCREGHLVGGVGRREPGEEHVAEDVEVAGKEAVVFLAEGLGDRELVAQAGGQLTVRRALGHDLVPARRPDEAAVQRVAPLVVRAAHDGAARLLLGHQLGAAVPAHVVEGPQLALLVRREQRQPGHLERQHVPRPADVRGVAHAHPLAPEDRRPFVGVHALVHVHEPAEARRLLERSPYRVREVLFPHPRRDRRHVLRKQRLRLHGRHQLRRRRKRPLLLVCPLRQLLLRRRRLRRSRRRRRLLGWCVEAADRRRRLFEDAQRALLAEALDD
mmetsp:Transcript_13157/g.39783  ORF Transcript_13157/g.39783 Transcript_13157/m.39783 type:complete len:320 (+) Transcript_13157:844-1803(+)